MRIDGFYGHGAFFATQVGDGATEVEAGDATGERDNPVGIHMPVVLAAAVMDDAVDKARLDIAIAEDAMLNARLQGVVDSGRGEEFGVGNPHRQDVGAAVFVPFV